MGTRIDGSPMTDWPEEFGCSDQRLVFKLTLKELRRLRKAMREAQYELAKGDECAGKRALEKIKAALDDREFA